MIDNPPRVLPAGCAIRLARGSWTVPPVFPWLQALGSVSEAEMYRVFNMGIGLVMIVAEHFAASIVRHLKYKVKVPAWIIGKVIEGKQDVVWE